MNRIVSTMLSVLCLVMASQSAFADNESSSPLELFEQRIMPIFRSEKPSSCVQCHLSSVDLKDYILPSHEKTFLSLRDQGLIDVENPAKSKILTLIGMGEKDKDNLAKRIHEKTRKAEYAAFAAWIEACCKDEKLAAIPKADKRELAKPAKELDVIRHARKSRVVNSFARNVFSQRMRCFPCHTPHEIKADNPRHKLARKNHKKFVEQYGAKMNIFGKTPEATMRNLVNSSRKKRDDAYPMLNLEEPAKSLLILKPTAKIPKKNGDKFEDPSSLDPVTHMGGLKMHKDDQSYKSFVAWIQDYAKVVGGKYTDVEDLPADNWFPTQLIVKVADTPKSWPKGTPVQIFLHKWNEQDSKWSDAIAFTQGTVTPRNRVNGAIFLLANNSPDATKDSRFVRPRNGKFLFKFFVDQKGKLKSDPALFLGKSDFKGQIEQEIKQWKPKFKFGKLINAKSLTTDGTNQ